MGDAVEATPTKPPAPICVLVSAENSTVDGHNWLDEGLGERFEALDFSVELCADPTYPQGCIKYVPCRMDDDPTCGHRVRSIFAKAIPLLWDGKWYWVVSHFNGYPELQSRIVSSVNSRDKLVEALERMLDAVGLNVSQPRASLRRAMSLAEEALALAKKEEPQSGKGLISP